MHRNLPAGKGFSQRQELCYSGVTLGLGTMSAKAVYNQGWSLDEVQWQRFDASKIEPWMLIAVKAAALVEFNAPDYVTYLKRVFPDAPTQAAIEEWGREETQHGRGARPLGRDGRSVLQHEGCVRALPRRLPAGAFQRRRRGSRSAAANAER